AGFLVEGDQGGHGAARCADQHVAVDQRRLGIGPVARGAAEVAAQVLVPARRALVASQTNQVAVRTETVQSIPVDGRRRAGAGMRLYLVLADFADSNRPDLL